MINNKEIKEAYLNGIISPKLFILIYAYHNRDNGVYAAKLSKDLVISYSSIFAYLTYLERKGYLVTVPSLQKHIRRKVLTDKAYFLFKNIGLMSENYPKIEW